jgi:hypothetical protein
LGFGYNANILSFKGPPEMSTLGMLVVDLWAGVKGLVFGVRAKGLGFGV